MCIYKVTNKLLGITIFEHYVYTNLPISFDKEPMLKKVSLIKQTINQKTLLRIKAIVN